MTAEVISYLLSQENEKDKDSRYDFVRSALTRKYVWKY